MQVIDASKAGGGGRRKVVVIKAKLIVRLGPLKTKNFVFRSRGGKIDLPPSLKTKIFVLCF